MTAITYHSWKFLKLEATPRGWTFEPVHWTVFSALAWTIFREGREYYLLRTWGAFWRHRKLTRKVTWYLIRKSSFKLSLAYRYVGLAGSRYQIIIKILSPRLPAPEERKCLTIKSFRSWAASEVCLISDKAGLYIGSSCERKLWRNITKDVEDSCLLDFLLRTPAMWAVTCSPSTTSTRASTTSERRSPSSWCSDPSCSTQESSSTTS